MADDLSTRHYVYNAAVEKLGYGARAYDKVLPVPLTLDDLEAPGDIAVLHIAEVIRYRSSDRQLLWRFRSFV